MINTLISSHISRERLDEAHDVDLQRLPQVPNQQLTTMFCFLPTKRLLELSRLNAMSEEKFSRA